MAQIDLGKLKFNWRGTWNNTTAYETDDVVFRNGQAYVATADEAAGQAAPEQNADWELMAAGINFRGQWNNAVTYFLNDAVTEDGALFILTGVAENAGSTGEDPALGGNWTAVSPAPDQNVLTEIGDLVYRNNEGLNARLGIGVNQASLSVQPANRETFIGQVFQYEEDGTGGNALQTPGSVAAATYNLTTNNVRNDHYAVEGEDRNGAIAWSQEPTIVVNIGDTIIFDNTATTAAHPMSIRVADGGASVTTGTYTGEGTATVTWNTTGVAAGTYFYQCQNHVGMIGQIVVRDITNRQGANNANGTMDVTRGQVYTITLDNVTNGVAYNLFTAAAPQVGAANALTAGEGNGAPAGTTFAGTPVTFTFSPNQTTPNTVFLASQANTGNMVTITVNDATFEPSWAATAADALNLETPDATNTFVLQTDNAQTANLTFTLPTAAPTLDRQVLVSTTGGVTSWASPTEINQTHHTFGSTVTGIPTWARTINVHLFNLAGGTTWGQGIRLGDANGLITSGYSGASAYLASGGSSGETDWNGSYALFGYGGTYISDGLIIIKYNGTSSGSHLWTFNGNNSMRPGYNQFMGGFLNAGTAHPITQIQVANYAGGGQSGHFRLTFE